MMLKKVMGLVGALVCLTSWCGAETLAELSGSVLDRLTHDPIPDAKILIAEQPWRTSSNADGYFSIKGIPPGKYEVQVNVLGYEPFREMISLGDGERKALTFSLHELVYEFNPVTVTATRERALASEVPSSVDVVSSRDLDQGNIQNIIQAVENIPGIVSNNYGGLGDLKTVSIRGSTSSQVLVLLDGQQMNSAQGGDIDLSTLPVSGVERIEVVRGGASALYGADAVGGVINIITRTRPFEESTGGTVKMLVGSFGTRGLEGVHSFYSHGLSSMISYKYLGSDGGFTFHSAPGVETSRANADVTSHNLFAKESWSFGGEELPKSLSLSGQYFYSNAGVPGSIYFLTPQARGRNRNGSLNLVYEQKIASPTNGIRVQTYYHNFEYLYDDLSSPDQNSDSHSIAWGADLQGRTSLAEWNTVIAGFAYRGDRVSSTSYESKRDRGLQSIYAQDQLSPALSEEALINRITVIPALRWDHFSDFGGRVSPKVGLIVSTGVAWQAALKANYGNSFRAPAFNDLYWKDPYSQGNPDLKPERGKDFDFGLMVRNPAALGLTADITYFGNDFSDLILWQSGPTGIYSPLNIGKAAVHGVETRFSVAPVGDLLQLSWSYTYLDSRNKTDVLVDYDNELPYRPKNSHAISAKVNHGDFYFLLSWNYTDKRYTTTANTFSLPPFHTTNVLIGFRPELDPSWLDMKFEIRNVGNSEYQIQDGFPMPGRELRFSLGLRYSQLLGDHGSQDDRLR